MRVLAHLMATRSMLSRRFPSHALSAVEDAITASERLHRAEIRVAIEVALDLGDLWRVRAARERAVEVFAELGVWNTTERNGVLIYILLAERDVEIVADRAFDGRVEEHEWQRVCTVIERQFVQGRWRDGVLEGIEAVTQILTREFPPDGAPRNEQLDRPAVL